jgi:hypothetical protein
MIGRESRECRTTRIEWPGCAVRERRDLRHGDRGGRPGMMPAVQRFGDPRMLTNPFADNAPLEFIWTLFILILGISILFS